MQIEANEQEKMWKRRKEVLSKLWELSFNTDLLG